MFERGFKSWCENTSLQIRKQLGISATYPLQPKLIADYLGVCLWEPREISDLSIDALETLMGEESDSWSALTVLQDGHHAIIYNPNHSLGRHASNLMHELSHIVIGHSPSTIVMSADGEFAIRSYDNQLEDEASWLSGCLLLPRTALISIINRGIDNQVVCEEYGVSNSLLEYRLNVTGVRTQMKRRKARSR